MPFTAIPSTEFAKNKYTDDIQLTTYSSDAWKGKSGSLWYVCRYNAICLLSSDIRKGDYLNQCGIHDREYLEAKDNIIFEGFVAYCIRNNTPNFYFPEEQEDSDQPEFNYEEYLKTAIEHEDRCYKFRDRGSEDFVERQLDALADCHQKATEDELYAAFQMGFNEIDSSVVLEILSTIYNNYAKSELSEQMDSHNKILCKIDNVFYTESSLYESRGRIPYLHVVHTYGTEYVVKLNDQTVVCGYIACLLNYCAYIELMNNLVPVHSGPVNYNHLRALSKHYISARDINVSITNKKELADTYIKNVFQAVKKKMLSDPNTFNVADQDVITQIYLNNKQWINDSALRQYLPADLYNGIVRSAFGFLDYMRTEYPYLIELEEEVPELPQIQLSITNHMQITDKDGNDVTLERARMSGWVLPGENEFLWPTYTAKATDDDKRTFESYLRNLCKSKKRSLTAEVKAYLTMKEKDGLILRPQQTNSEYEIIKKFGYPYQEKSYYNA